jgi:hypothetical protein
MKLAFSTSILVACLFAVCAMTPAYATKKSSTSHAHTPTSHSHNKNDPDSCGNVVVTAKSNVWAGKDSSVSIKITNSGASTLKNGVLVLTLPDGVAIDQGKKLFNVGLPTVNGLTVTWTNVNINKGSKFALSIPLTITNCVLDTIEV